MSLSDVLKSLPEFQSEEILKSFIKGYSIINNPMYKNIACSISGGSDSDIVLDIVHKIDEKRKIRYVWFDTGLEYRATKEHLQYLENKYNIEIERIKAIKPIPACCREYGQPFLSKRVSELLSRLQRHSFKWEDEKFEVLIEKYPKCKSALKWWCNEFEKGSRFNIDYNKGLKEFIVENPPWFNISQLCCNYAKKKVIHNYIKDSNIDLNIYGVRKAEGGARSTAYKNCYTSGEDSIDSFRPIFWFKEQDKKEYEIKFDIKHSDCYTTYGFKRTGCSCCPYGRDLIDELDIAEKYEPSLYKAVNNVFRDSYKYTRQYREFCAKKSGMMYGQITIFDFLKG